MSAITTKIVEKYNLSPEMSVTDLSRYTSEFLENLTDDRRRNQARRRLREGFKFTSEQGSCRIAVIKPPKSLEEEIVREITKRILQNRYGFSGDQVEALFDLQSDLRRLSDQKNESKTVNIVISNQPSKGIKKESIGDMAQRFLRDKLSIRDVRAEAHALALSAKNANAGSSRLSRLRRELRNLNASLEIIEATKFPDITEDANKIQMDNRKKAETKPLAYNILKEFEDPIVSGKDLSELNCSECDKKIISSPHIKSFTTLKCGHTFHRLCLEKKILLAYPNVCPYPNCDEKLDLIEFPRRDSESIQNMSQTRSSGSENSEHLHDPDFLSNSASSFNTRDVRSLRVSFCSATQANEVIPNRNVNIPQEYILPGVNRTVLAMEELDIDQLCQNDHDYVKTFIYKLHEVVKNTKLVIGTSEASTDTLFLKDCITFKLRLHPLFKFYVGNVILSAKAEFDKHLNNIRPTNDYGEPQIGAEILACGDENIRQAREAFNMTIFAVRVVSTYVTFYRATISKSYWNELAIGCPRQQSITVLRWPGNSSDPIVGFDLAEPNGRRGNVKMANNNITLNCLAIPNSPRNQLSINSVVLTITISRDATVDDLQTAIQNQLSPPFNNIPLDIRQIYYSGSVDERRMRSPAPISRDDTVELSSLSPCESRSAFNNSDRLTIRILYKKKLDIDSP
ncbi:7135_t:CDS:2 [Entrophospora sp. SA101]|nr:7135_t:CDS:2 [Entrophospora sp. SA101]